MRVRPHFAPDFAYPVMGFTWCFMRCIFTLLIYAAGMYDLASSSILRPSRGIPEITLQSGFPSHQQI